MSTREENNAKCHSYYWRNHVNQHTRKLTINVEFDIWEYPRGNWHYSITPSTGPSFAVADGFKDKVEAWTEARKEWRRIRERYGA